MKLDCDTERILEISKDIKSEAERYKETMKKFYEIINSLNAIAWTGEAARNYTRYLNSKSARYGGLYQNIVQFCQTLDKDVAEIEETIRKSTVNEND